jgi:hypothetical protein
MHASLQRVSPFGQSREVCDLTLPSPPEDIRQHLSAVLSNETTVGEFAARPWRPSLVSSMQNSRERNRKTEDHLCRRVDRLDRCLRQTRKHGAGRLLIDVLVGPARRRRGRYYHGIISGAPHTAVTAATSRPCLPREQRVLRSRRLESHALP